MAKMKKGTKIFIILAAVVVVVAAALFGLVRAGQKALEALSTGAVSYSALERMDLENTLSVSGNIQSADVKKVYQEATGAGKALAVNVEVGDSVQEGDVLCVFDSADLEEDLEKTRLQAEQSEKSAQISLDSAKNNYNTGVINQDQAVRAAEQNLEAMQDQLTSAQDDYNDALEDYNSGKLELTLQVDAEYTQAQYAYTSAKKTSNDLYLAMRDAQSAAESNPEDQDAQKAYASALADYQAAQVQTDNAKAAFDAARELYESKDTQVESLLDDYRDAVTDAQENVDDAQVALEEAKEQRELALHGYSNSVSSAQIATDQTVTEMNLADAQENIEKCTVTAPASGTVTAIYVTEGESNAAGSLLFVIEDLENLEIVTSVREYDIGSLAVGMPAEIKTDATGDTVYAGQVKDIAVTAQKDAYGNTIASSNAEFDVTLTVDPGQGGLLVGMNGRATITTDSTEGVLAVLYSSLGYAEDGSTYVSVARPQENGTLVVERVPVETGVETDFEVEVRSDALAEGDLILDDPEAVPEGTVLPAVTAG
ncbi:MAG: efflux RND transporter periplasmic adaptor subunit [Candidatus Spyradocola sp.]|jgi:HlyD family secretion protein